jgi:prepilin peptidase CpaA
MPFTEIARWTVAALFTAALAWASFTDIRDRKIRNPNVLAVLALFVPWAALGAWGGDWASVFSDVEAGALALLICVGIYAAGMVGAGDAKLFAAVSLFFGLPGLPGLAMTTAMVGGAMAAVTLAANPRRTLVLVTMRGKGDTGRGVPYGVAIATAAIVLIWNGLLHLGVPWLVTPPR